MRVALTVELDTVMHHALREGPPHLFLYYCALLYRFLLVVRQDCNDRRAYHRRNDRERAKAPTEGTMLVKGLGSRGTSKRVGDIRARREGEEPGPVLERRGVGHKNVEDVGNTVLANYKSALRQLPGAALDVEDDTHPNKRPARPRKSRHSCTRPS